MQVVCGFLRGLICFLHKMMYASRVAFYWGVMILLVGLGVGLQLNADSIICLCSQTFAQLMGITHVFKAGQLVHIGSA